MKSKLFFTEKALPLILEAFNMSIDEHGFIISPNGKKIKASQIQGIKKDKRYKDNIRIIVES